MCINRVVFGCEIQSLSLTKNVNYALPVHPLRTGDCCLRLMEPEAYPHPFAYFIQFYKLPWFSNKIVYINILFFCVFSRIILPNNGRCLGSVKRVENTPIYPIGTISYICIPKGSQVEIQTPKHEVLIGRWVTARRLCYRPAVFFRHLCLIAPSFA